MKAHYQLRYCGAPDFDLCCEETGAVEVKRSLERLTFTPP